MLYLLSALSVMYILWMYYISLLLLPPDGFVLCYIGLLVLTLWCFDDDVISPSPGKGRYINCVLKGDERSSGSSVSEGFAEWMMKNGLIDLGYVGQKFSWWHGGSVENRRAAQ